MFSNLNIQTFTTQTLTKDYLSSKGVSRLRHTLTHIPTPCSTHLFTLSSELLSTFLNSIRNTHSSLPRDKLVFMLRVLNGPVKLLHARASNLSCCLIKTYVSHLMSYLDTTMPRLDYKPDVRSNQDFMVCLGKLLEMLADRELGTTDEDVEMVVPLLVSLMRVAMLLQRTNPLYVCVERKYLLFFLLQPFFFPHFLPTLTYFLPMHLLLSSHFLSTSSQLLMYPTHFFF